MNSSGSALNTRIGAASVAGVAGVATGASTAVGPINDATIAARGSVVLLHEQSLDDEG
jgi:hypothetical protein